MGDLHKKLSPPQKAKFISACERAGLTPEQALVVIRDGDLARELFRPLPELIRQKEDVRRVVPQPVKHPDRTKPLPLKEWPTVEQQIAKAHRLWPSIVIPEPPRGFVGRSDTEKLLLHNPLAFSELWSTVEIPGVEKDPGDLLRRKGLPCLQDHALHHAKPVWVAFDYGSSGLGLRNDPAPAAGEGLSALIQHPEWAYSWGAMRVQLSGYSAGINKIVILSFDGKCLQANGDFRRLSTTPSVRTIS